MSSFKQGWIKFWFKPQGPQILGFGRALFFALILWFFWQYSLKDWAIIDWQISWQPVSFFKFFQVRQPTAEQLVWLGTVWKISLFTSCIGLFTRLSLTIAFLSSLFMFGIPLNFGKIHHSNHTIVMVMGILTFSRCGAYFSVDALLRKLMGQSKLSISSDFRWPAQLIRFYILYIYFASAVQKFVNSGFYWMSAENLQTIILTRPTVTELGVWTASHTWLSGFLAITTIIVEGGAPLAFIHRHLALFWVPSCFMLHIGTYLLLGNHGAFWPYLFCYAFWLPWDYKFSNLKAFQEPC